MNYLGLTNPKNKQIRTYNCDTLESNWFEDRCIRNFDKKQKEFKFLLPSSYSWQFETTYNEMSDKSRKEFPSVKEKFIKSSDNLINYQDKDYNMYLTTTKHAYDERYKESFRQPINERDYFKNKKDELESYRNKWTKRSHLFDSTYKTDILAKTGTSLVASNKFHIK